jgi:hypothetical protein
MKTLPLVSLAAVLVSSLVPGAARAQLRSVDLAFRDPNDARVVGFHVYVASASNAYGDWRDDIQFVPPPDANGASHYSLSGLEALSDVYISLRSYDATGAESGFSNELLVAAEEQCIVTGCDDGNPCTLDRCTATGCSHDPAPQVGQTCDDGNATTYSDVCQASGQCAGTPGQCNAASDCPAPADACAGPAACVSHQCVVGSAPEPDETACSDGNAATQYDVCRSGTCRGFACGSDAQCSDGQACNGAERCVANACVAGTPMACDDGNACNGTETCVGSACVAGTALACSTDQGPCFDAFCDATAGCQVQTHPDGSSCQTSQSGSAGTCSAGVCVAQSVPAPTPPPPTTAPAPKPQKPRKSWWSSRWVSR